MSVKILHFADAHIDRRSGGKTDTETGLPVRVVDFLKSLDTIVDTAIDEGVQLVLFAGDAYKSPMPAPTFVREWDKRLRRLADAHIPVLLIEGNHDRTPAYKKAGALQELGTFDIPYIHLAKQVELWTPEMLDGVPIQVLTVPWISKSAMIAHEAAAEDLKGLTQTESALKMEAALEARVERELANVNKNLPVVLLAHYGVRGARYASGQEVAYSEEVTLSKGLVTRSDFAYSALGHIHKYQDLNEGAQPPAVYSGSIEHVDYGEAKEKKGFIIAEVDRGGTEYEFRKLDTRPMYNLVYEYEDGSGEEMTRDLLELLPEPELAREALVKLTVKYPHEMESAIDERALREKVKGAAEFRLLRKPEYANRIRVAGETIAGMTPQSLLERYCEVYKMNNYEKLSKLADEIFNSANDVTTEG